MRVVGESLPLKACRLTPQGRETVQWREIKLHPFRGENETPCLKPQCLHRTGEFNVRLCCFQGFADAVLWAWEEGPFPCVLLRSPTSGMGPGLSGECRGTEQLCPCLGSDVLLFEDDKWSHRELLLWYELFPLLLNNKHDHSDLLTLQTAFLLRLNLSNGLVFELSNARGGWEPLRKGQQKGVGRLIPYRVYCKAR